VNSADFAQAGFEFALGEPEYTISILDSGIERADQQPTWPDPALADEVRAELRRRPALVTGQEVADLAEALAAAQRRRAFVLHAGDCAELFAAASARSTRRKVTQVGVLADTISRAAGLPVVRVGRIAGQFAKPRSSPVDRLPSGHSVPSYRGDAVNDIAATPAARTPDPRRLLAAYDTARATLDVIRDACLHLPEGERLYTAHEFLLLDYEVPLVRDGLGGSYATSAHTGWVGYRTHSPGGRHVALAASITNPVAVKVGPVPRAGTHHAGPHQRGRDGRADHDPAARVRPDP
jgi:3-deoxy-7-phosphoheptulonate synthase